jgi:hypothetical protein
MSNNTILAGPDGIRMERALYSASSPITPGILAEYVTNTLTVRPHSSDGGTVYDVMIAVEEPENSGHGIDDAYAVAGEIVQLDFSPPGSHRYMLLEAGENVAAGALLESAGDGTLEAGSSNPVVRALEAVNNSAGYSAKRIYVEVL